MRHQARGLFAGLLAALTVACGGGDGGSGGAAPLPVYTAGPVSPLVGVLPFDLTIGYFDADGHRDLIAPGLTDLTQAPYVTGASVLLGAADGTFTARSPIEVGVPEPSESFRALPGHFDEDGDLDLLLVSGRQYSVLLGRGDGAFDPAGPNIRNLPFGLEASDAAVIDGDGNLRDDFVVGTNSGSVAFLLAIGGGDFVLVDEYTVAPGEFIRDLVVVDMDEDGIDDVVVLDSGGGLTVLLCDLSGSFTLGWASGPGGYPHTVRIRVGEFDALPGLDLAAMQNLPTPAPKAQVMVVTGDGAGGFAFIDGTADLPEATCDAAAVVRTPDPTDGLVVRARAPNYGAESLYRIRTDATGQPTAEKIPVEGSLVAFRAADMNGDLAMDLVLLKEGPTAMEVQVLYATGR